jgi:SAM-dependent methyltransferase
MATAGGNYVQYGAGTSAPAGWLNYDVSPTLRVQKLPLVGKVLARLSGNASLFPDSLLYGDILKGLPVAPDSVDGLYASHVLEHLSLADMRAALRNSFAVLKPGGVFRLIVPDLLGRARLYVDKASAGDPGASLEFMRGTLLGLESRPQGVWSKMRAQIGNTAHLWMWDYPSMEQELKSAGFVDIRRAEIGDSADPMFDRVEERGRFFDGDIVETAVEARKPLSPV